MLKVGITGGIGSGKSLIKKLFQLEDIPVYDADFAGKWLLNNSLQVKNHIKTIFGAEIYNANGFLDRKKMAALVFNDKAKLKELTSIVHPAVAQHSLQWFQKIDADKKFAIKEAAILIESGSYKDLDKIILVTAPLETRIERVIKRDKTTKEQVLARAKLQWSDEKKLPFVDYVIENFGNKKLIPQVQHLISEIDKINS